MKLIQKFTYQNVRCMQDCTPTGIHLYFDVTGPLSKGVVGKMSTTRYLLFSLIRDDIVSAHPVVEWSRVHIIVNNSIH